MMALYMAATEQQQHFLQSLHYLAPALILIYFLIATTVSVCTLQNLKASGPGPRKVLVSLVSLLVISFLVESCMLLTDTAINGARHSSTESNVYALFSLLVWTIITVSLVNTKNPGVWYPYYGSWFIGLVAEAILFAFVLTYGISPSAFAYLHVTIQACRTLILVLLSTVLFTKSCQAISADEESASLLGHGKGELDGTQASSGNSGYGSIAISPNGEDSDLEYEAEQRKKDQGRKELLEKRLQAEGNWFTYAKAFSIFMPHLWPSKDRILQAKILGVCLCLFCERALNVLEPRQFGIVVDRLGMSQGHVPTLFLEFGLWVLFSQGSIIRQMRHMLWLPVEQYAEGSIKTASYNHIMGLSRDFHTTKHSAELYTAISQGNSLKQIAETLLFSVLPMFVDVAVAFVYLYWVFGPYMALIVAATTVIFVWASFAFVGQQVEPRRKCNALKRREFQVMYDTVGGWSSVSYFNRHGYEKGRYADVVGLSIKADYKWISLHYISQVAKDTIIELGMISACILAIYQITKGAPVGGFVMLVSYWYNFTVKLESFVDVPRELIGYLTDAESLLDLFLKKPSVKDGQELFKFKHGTISFHDVGFSYDGQKEVIKDFNFHAGPGQKIGLVGETGGGKSTILRLLFRFYDARKGSIMIDGQDIRDVTLSSLREHIGVVPQDPALFNASIMENVRYARLEATDEEVVEACKTASIHEKILNFTNGYSTKVGENGVKLSGGELQRVAIARVMLQNPGIILLDEATSSVDTETEGNIRNALEILTKGRTTFTVAHRLSTVASSDTILVIKDGIIVEQGTPRELLKSKGKFHDLWHKQFDTDLLLTDFDPIAAPQSKLSDVPETSSGEENRRSSESSASGNKSLRATAPDFVPGFQRGVSASRDQTSDDHGNEAHQPSHESNSVKKNGAKRNQKNKGSATGSEPTCDAVLSDSWPTTSDSKNLGQIQPENKKKRGNFNPRRGNKSEPSGPTVKSSHNDEPSDEPPRNQPRRLSAAGTDAANQASSGQGHRRQWYQRRRKAAHSEIPSGEASGAWSSDTLRPSTNETSSDSANATGPTTRPHSAAGGVGFATGF
ncbi:MAG: hypothetical protein ASARMPREDX12_003784 [Alectoria sarmentosa]|nr:MAG: hypothetical protein ASARMPREDX12_003784 [Alectoria sarmentosa]